MSDYLRDEMGKILILCGIMLIILGLLINYVDKIPYLGRLPGDIVIERKNFKFYFPVVTSILLSVLISIVLYLLGKMKN